MNNIYFVQDKIVSDNPELYKPEDGSISQQKEVSKDNGTNLFQIFNKNVFKILRFEFLDHLLFFESFFAIKVLIRS